MNAATARKVIPAAMVVTSIAVGVAYFKKDRSPGSGFRTAWALGALFLILSLGADMAPEAAGPLALLVMLGVTVNSDFVLGDLLHLTNQQQVQPSGGKQSPTTSTGAKA